jgi:Mono-functional DNA-alkylating methyl methanesulfonate N-term
LNLISKTYQYKINNSVQRIWSLTDPKSDTQDGNMAGFIVVTMTFNETKFLRWTSLSPRKDGTSWIGDLDIDDYTANLSSSLRIAEPTLATGVTKGGIVQVTPAGVFLESGDHRLLGNQERVVHASVIDDHIALVVYNSEPSWTLVYTQVLRDETSQEFLSAGISYNLPGEPSAIKLFVEG